MFTGTLTNASVHPREIFKEAMRLGCARIMVAHNHPSGDPTPSNADIELTNHIVESGKDGRNPFDGSYYCRKKCIHKFSTNATY